MSLDSFSQMSRYVCLLINQIDNSDEYSLFVFFEVKTDDFHNESRNQLNISG